jgi:hypothetical protein
MQDGEVEWEIASKVESIDRLTISSLSIEQVQLACFNRGVQSSRLLSLE